MKIFHIADLHIGKIVNEFSMLEDQKYALNKIIELIKKEEPEIIIMAGDIYDRSIPPAEAINLFDDFINEVVMKNRVKVLAISGNHDSGDRLNYGSGIFTENGFFIQGRLKEDIASITFKDEFGNINFFLAPYEPPVVVRKLFKDESIKTYNDAMNAIVNKIKVNLNKNDRNILITHGYVSGMAERAAQECESEKPLSIGGSDIISSEILKEFDYVALGHLHGPQRVTEDYIRYSGSLLKYSFSEENHKKGVTVIELNKKGNFNYRHEEIKPLRNLRTIKGKLQRLIEESSRTESENKYDYIQAILTDEGEILDPMAKIRAVYPNTMIIKRENIRSFENSSTSAPLGFRDMNELELFKDYYGNVGSFEFSKIKEKLVKEILDEVFVKGE